MHALEMLPGLAQRANHALVRHAQALDRLAQDSFVSLMEYKMIDVFDQNGPHRSQAYGPCRRWR